MYQKRQYKLTRKLLKEEAVALVIDQGYTVPDAAQPLGAEPIYFMAGSNSSKINDRLLNVYHLTHCGMKEEFW